MRHFIWVLVVVGCGGGTSETPPQTPPMDASVTAPGTGAPSTTGPSTTPTTPAVDWWQPTAGLTWQWQLQGQLDLTLDVAVYDLDLFDVEAAAFTALQADDRRVICYFSAGSIEDWRDDAADFDAAGIGEPLDGWPGERWVDTRAQGVRDIMAARLDLAASKGCDAVEPDNVDGHQANSGFPLTVADTLDYLAWLSAESHSRGLAVGLKNAVELVGEVHPDFDFTVNESCLDWSECGGLMPFLDANKPVFHTEYVDQASQGAAMQAAVCGESSIAGFSTLIKTWDLDAWLLACD